MSRLCRLGTRLVGRRVVLTYGRFFQGHRRPKRPVSFFVRPRGGRKFNSTRTMKALRHIFLSVSVASITIFGLAACGSKTLDYRNAQISNGKIFAGEDNHPFSGHLTSLPDQQLRNSQSGLVQIMQFVGLGNQNFHGGASTVFCDVDVKEGYLDGKATCKESGSGLTRYEMAFTGGALDGDVKVYAPTSDNNVISEVSFEKGRADGEQKIYNIVTTNLVYDLHWQRGISVGDQSRFDAGTGKMTFQSHFDDEGKLDGDYVESTPDGIVFHKLRYAHGQKNGAEDAFDNATGKPTSHIEWQNDRMNGTYRKWDADGNLVTDDTYQDGALVPTAAEQQAASEAAAGMAHADCMKKWQRASMALDVHTVSPQEEVGQWEASCQQGILPD
ncbi:toxin-antitoxin system YwqK family antitoxin [Paraburkholderia fungorum]|uniref:toxin-antitoxin system YwqK family antitoxin n=1 Tax=Paraburkholderia fungorum TaxID=134537 RepID=UPI0038B974CA